MGTVAQKLEKLQDTKTNIKNAIIAKGQSIPDNLPFADYPSKIEAIESNSKEMQWKESTLPDYGSWGFAYGGGIFVAISSNVTQGAYSIDNGKTWNLSTLPSSQGYGWGLPLYGDGAFISLEITSTRLTDRIIYSIDGGKTWTVSTLPSIKQWRLKYGNGTFIAISGSNIAYSKDGGKTWNSSSISGNENWGPFTYGNGIFITASNGNQVAYSEDNGKTWTIVTLPYTANWTTIVYGDGTFILSNGGSMLLYSNDNGKTWATSTLPVIETNFSPDAFAYGDGIFMATMRYPYIIIYSIDKGKTWIANEEVPIRVSTSLTYGNGIFLMGEIYPSGIMAYSTNKGKTWTTITLSEKIVPTTICYGNNTFIVTNSNPSNKSFCGTLTIPTSTPEPVELATPSISVDSEGLITASISQEGGYVEADYKYSTKRLDTTSATVYTPGTANQTIPAGKFLTGAQTIKGDASLIANNIRKGTSIFGVQGNLEAPQTATLTFNSQVATNIYILDARKAEFAEGSNYKQSILNIYKVPRGRSSLQVPIPCFLITSPGADIIGASSILYQTLEGSTIPISGETRAPATGEQPKFVASGYSMYGVNKDVIINIEIAPK